MNKPKNQTIMVDQKDKQLSEAFYSMLEWVIIIGFWAIVLYTFGDL